VFEAKVFVNFVRLFVHGEGGCFGDVVDDEFFSVDFDFAGVHGAVDGVI